MWQGTRGREAAAIESGTESKEEGREHDLKASSARLNHLDLERPRVRSSALFALAV